MKITPVGLFPEGWELIQLGTKASVLRGGSPRPIDSFLTNDPDGINWIKIGDVAVGAKYIKQTEEKIIPEGAVRSRKVYAGDFLLSNSMSFGRPYILQIDGCIHDGWLVIQEYYDTFETDYLYYALNSGYVLEQYKSLAAGSSVLNLNKDIVKRVNVAVPSRSEQKRIAEALSGIDNMIVTLDEAIAKKSQIKEGLIQQLLTGKTRLPGFTGEWKETRLGDIFDFYKGTGLSKADIDSTGNNQCILYGEIFTKYNIAVKGEISRTASCVGTPSVKGDILMPGSTTTVGIDLVKAVFVDTDSILLGGDIIILRKKEQVDSAFVAEKAQGTTIIHLHGKNLTDIRYLVPESEQEQKGISTVVSKVDADIEELNYKKNKLILLKQGMMQELLTGKTRLI